MIQQLWKNKFWPIQNGIYFADNTVTTLEVSMPWENAENSVSISVSDSIPLERMTGFIEGERTHLASLCEYSSVALNVRLFAVEGAHGSEGFVAVTQIVKGELLWLAYFDCSNPFEKVSMTNGIVTAVSNLAHSWRFPIRQPERLSVDIGKQ